MPVKKTTMKRKLKTSIDNSAAPPTKIGKRGGTPVPEEVFHAQRNHQRGPGVVLTLGQGDVGQLGLGPDVMEKARPALVPDVTDVVDVCAGGMHTMCLTSSGEVITFGCNDEGALGRPTPEEGSESRPGKVELDGKVVQISAGDSHSAALLEDGRVFAWGAFRDSHGTMGLTPKGIMPNPMLVPVDDKVVRIESGTDHLMLLTRHGQLYTCGCGEQGQLGRIAERAASRESRQGLSKMLIPAKVQIKHLEFDNVWAGAYCTFMKEKRSDHVFSFGLNNYGQICLKNVNEKATHFHPVQSQGFSDKKWAKICGGQHHTLALDSDGVVYASGRKDYGRLGLGSDCPEVVDKPTVVPGLQGKKCIDIACGTCVSFAVTEDGEVYAWGMGTNGQLGTGDEDDHYEPVRMGGKQLEGRKVVAVSGGGQHTVLLVTTDQNS
ncbi:regulator of chromosome condensation-like isoform X2 [Macrosteles quadrilineatus]|uniref:regulator of chromosome condensation-like isoform X2 n=1 Tax=Macrosteles quadrilineatus TaxID=74068 RepID=UPI0023E2B1C5|nr:regulator of chromosome condensation-like isoform X2 [Macrosteles quadrilineatus]